MPSPKPVVSIRRPSQPADPLTVERFVAAAQDVTPETPRRPDVQAPISAVPATGAGIVCRQSGRVRRRMTVYLPPELAKKLVVRGAEAGVEISDLVEEAVASYLSREPTTPHNAT